MSTLLQALSFAARLAPPDSYWWWITDQALDDIARQLHDSNHTLCRGRNARRVKVRCASEGGLRASTGGKAQGIAARGRKERRHDIVHARRGRAGLTAKRPSCGARARCPPTFSAWILSLISSSRGSNSCRASLEGPTLWWRAIRAGARDTSATATTPATQGAATGAMVAASPRFCTSIATGSREMEASCACSSPLRLQAGHLWPMCSPLQTESICV